MTVAVQATSIRERLDFDRTSVIPINDNDQQENFDGFDIQTLDSVLREALAEGRTKAKSGTMIGMPLLTTLLVFLFLFILLTFYTMFAPLPYFSPRFGIFLAILFGGLAAETIIARLLHS